MYGITKVWVQSLVGHCSRYTEHLQLLRRIQGLAYLGISYSVASSRKQVLAGQASQLRPSHLGTTRRREKSQVSTTVPRVSSKFSIMVLATISCIFKGSPALFGLKIYAFLRPQNQVLSHAIWKMIRSSQLENILLRIRAAAEVGSSYSAAACYCELLPQASSDASHAGYSAVFFHPRLFMKVRRAAMRFWG